MILLVCMYVVATGTHACACIFVVRGDYARWTTGPYPAHVNLVRQSVSSPFFREGRRRVLVAPSHKVQISTEAI
jgi:hypothetical protein